MSAIVGMLGTVTLEEGAVLVAAEFFAPALLIIAPLVFLEIIRPGAIEEAEENGMFNTAEYLQNNDLQDQMWDVMLQFFGMGSGPPTGVWDESNEYIQNNPNVQRNLQDIKNLKNQIYSGALSLFMPDEGIPTLEELQEAYQNAAYVYIGIAESGDTELYNLLISIGNNPNPNDPNYNPDNVKKARDKLNEAEDLGKMLTSPPGTGKPDDDDDRESKFYGYFVKKIKLGMSKLVSGDITGLWDITIGTAGLDVVVVGQIIYECYEAVYGNQ
jgi:hypothetical protein